MFTFKITLGDYSADGHGQTEEFVLETNAANIEEVREAYFKARESTGFDFADKFCSKYEESEPSEEALEQLEKLGFTIPPGRIDPVDMLAYLLQLLKIGDPKLKFGLIEEEKLPSFEFYGFDEKKRHIGSIGYGLFLP